MSVVLCVNLIDRRRSRRNTAGAGLPLVRYTCTYMYIHAFGGYIYIYIYIPNLKRSLVVFTSFPMVARWSPSILHSFIQSYVVARSSYGGCSISYDQSWQIADSRRLSYDGRATIDFRLQNATIIEDLS